MEQSDSKSGEIIRATSNGGRDQVVMLYGVLPILPALLVWLAAGHELPMWLGIALTCAMAVDHGPDGIRVNCVAPGPVYTPMVYSRQMSPAARDARRRASVLGIEGTGWDIGHAVRFLLSAQARYITGHTLVVDGGATLVGPARATE